MKNLKNMCIVSLMLAMLMIFSGCSGKHCINVGGNYEGIQGNIEYCFDAPASKEIGAPVLKNPGGVSSVIVSEDEAKKINALIEGKDSSSDAPKVQAFQSELKRLVEHIKK